MSLASCNVDLRHWPVNSKAWEEPIRTKQDFIIVKGKIWVHWKRVPQQLSWSTTCAHGHSCVKVVAVQFYGMKGTKGARPCIRCGYITASWCEGCSLRGAYALCSKCDSEALLDAQMEVSGYTDDYGNFVSLNPPLILDTNTIPRSHI